MTTPDRNVILKEMGITQWVMRDAESLAGAAPEDLGVPGQKNLDQGEQQLAPASPSTETDGSPEASPHTPEVASGAPDISTTQTPELSPVMPDVEVVQEIDIPVESLDALRTQVAACNACDLAKSRTQTVFGEGPDQADWMFVGEAPGQQEDRQGKPFVGRAGGLLSQIIGALDRSRDQVFIANTLKCRPPDNRDPLPGELQACEAYLLRQIDLVQPKVMVALGRIAAQALLKSDQPLGKLRGQVYRYGPNNIPLIVTYHPAYLLRQPGDKGKVWEDLLLAHRQLPV